MKNLIPLFLAISLSSPAHAQNMRDGAHMNEPMLAADMIAGVALNAAAATRTITINNPLGGYAFANLEVARTRVTGTDLTMTCKSTAGTGTPVAQRTTCVFDAAGICTSSTATMKSGTSISETLAWVLNIMGWGKTTCVFASTAAGGTDLITVSGNMVVDGAAKR